MNPTFADKSLSDESPEHIGAVVAIGGLVEGLLAEKVPLLDHFGGPLRCGARRTSPSGHIGGPSAGPNIPKSHVF